MPLHMLEQDVRCEFVVRKEAEVYTLSFQRSCVRLTLSSHDVTYQIGGRGLFPLVF